MRRAYLDLWGMLPRPEQFQAFAADRGPDKRQRLVRELLANRRNYAEHWISFWNDLLRNDEGVIYHGLRESISNWLFPRDREQHALRSLRADAAQPHRRRTIRRDFSSASTGAAT